VHFLPRLLHTISLSAVPRWGPVASSRSGYLTDPERLQSLLGLGWRC
jgi:hypothetical protein